MFKITIEKINTVVEESRERVIVDERVYTEEDLENAYDRDSYKGLIKKVYEYQDVPRPEKLEIKVFEQVTEELDLSAVIKAINKL